MKLTDTQSAVLSAAAARTDGAILPLPSHLRGGAIAKVCDDLKAKGLAAVVGEGGEERIVISDAGQQALGLPIQAPAIILSEPVAIKDEEGTAHRHQAGAADRDAENT